MTDREEFEAHIDDSIASSMGFDLAIAKDDSGEYTTLWVGQRWAAWQACASIKQRRIDELEAQLHMARFGAGGDAQNNPAGGRGFSGTRMSLAEPIVAVYGGGGWITQDANGPIPPEPQEPKP